MSGPSSSWPAFSEDFFIRGSRLEQYLWKTK